MRIALSAKNKFCFVNGVLLRPPSTDPNLAHWDRCNDMIISWIINVVSAEIRSSIIYNYTTRGIWQELEVRYGQSSGSQIFSIKKEISTIAQGSISIPAYFGKMKSLWDVLRSLQRFPQCSCGAVTEILKYEEDQKLFQLLMGLNESYNAVRGRILMMRPLPSVDYAYSLLAEEEKQREIKTTSSLSEDLASFHVQGRKPPQPQNNQQQNHKPNSTSVPAKSSDPHAKKQSLFCTNCKKTNHTIDRCFFHQWLSSKL